MTWHFRKANANLEIFPGESPGGAEWSKTYKTFAEVRAAAAVYLRALREKLAAEEPPAAPELLDRIAAREAEIRGLTLSDLPVELLSNATPEAAMERAQHEVDMQRLRRRPFFAGLFLILGLILLLVSFLAG